MPSFLTQCPHCLTSFRVTDAQLEAAEGLVRCGACLGIFSAAANRITLKQSPEDAAAAAQAGAAAESDAADASEEIPVDEARATDALAEAGHEDVAAPLVEDVSTAAASDLHPVAALPEEPLAAQAEPFELP